MGTAAIKRASAALLALLVAGCETSGPVSSGAACEIFKPISWAQADTKQTKAEVKEHNAAGKAACKWP